MFLYSFSVSAQVENVEVTYSKEAATKHEVFRKVMGSSEGYYIMTTLHKGYNPNPDRFIDKYDTEMNLVSSEEIKFKQKDQEYVSVEYINNKLYIFSSIKNKDIKQHGLFVQEMDKNTLQLSEEKKKLASILIDGKNINENNILDGKNIKEGHVFAISLSPYGSKLGIIYSPNSTKNSRKENYKLTTQVYNTISFDLLWQKEIELPYSANIYSNISNLIDDLGNTHSLGEISKDFAEADQFRKEYVVISQLNEGSVLKTNEVSIEKYLSDISIIFNTNKDIICTALYSNKFRRITSKSNGILFDRQHYPIDGTCFFSINGKTGEKIHENFEEFGVEFIAKNRKEGKINRLENKSENDKDISLENYYIHSIIPKEDGGVFITAQYYNDKPEGNIRNQTLLSHDLPVLNEIIGLSGSADRLYSESIIIINLSSEGKTIWNEKIPLSQVTAGIGYFRPDGYSVLYKDKKLHLIFNDHIKNTLGENKEADETYIYNVNTYNDGYSMDKEQAITLLTMDNEGNYKREVLIKQNVKEDTHIYPNRYFQVAENQLFVLARGKKVYRFVKFKFD